MLLYDEFKQIDIRHMEPNEIITNIGTFVLPLVTAAAGWTQDGVNKRTTSCTTCNLL